MLNVKLGTANIKGYTDIYDLEEIEDNTVTCDIEGVKEVQEWHYLYVHTADARELEMINSPVRHQSRSQLIENGTSEGKIYHEQYNDAPASVALELDVSINIIIISIYVRPSNHALIIGNIIYRIVHNQLRKEGILQYQI